MCDGTNKTRHKAQAFSLFCTVTRLNVRLSSAHGTSPKYYPHVGTHPDRAWIVNSACEPHNHINYEKQ